MKTELVTLMVYKIVLFTGLLFQIDTTCMIMAQIDPTVGMDIYKIVSNFGIVGFLILAIKYFISESKRMQKDFAIERAEQEERHILEKDKMIRLHEKEIENMNLRLGNVQEELVNLKIELAKIKE